MLFRLAISFVNACEGYTWVPKLASDRLMSVRLFGRIPFGKCRRESANFPEDSVTPRYEKMCNLSPHHLPPVPLKFTFGSRGVGTYSK